MERSGGGFWESSGCTFGASSADTCPITSELVNTGWNSTVCVMSPQYAPQRAWNGPLLRTTLPQRKTDTQKQRKRDMAGNMGIHSRKDLRRRLASGLGAGIRRRQ